jgi:S-adenosylmethionine hydrolase
MAGICPDARVIDVTHGVPRGDVRAGALMLRSALSYTPIGVHLAVVDPGVGGDRRAVALRLADGRLLVGPDNGLLSLAGPVLEAVDIGASRFSVQPISATFHGRDIFAPVAARLAAGAGLSDAGQPIDPGGLVRLELPRPRVEAGVLVAHAIYIDGFGNVQLDAGTGAFALEVGGEALVGTTRARYVRTFGDAAVGELLLYEDSNRRLAVAVNQGNAAEQLGLAADDEVRIAPA